MKKTHIAVIAWASLCLAMAGCTKIGLSVYVSPVALVDVAHNKPSVIRQEILDPQLMALIGKANGLSGRTIAGFKVVLLPDSDQVWLEYSGMSRAAFPVVLDQLQAYVRGREKGHTREFMVFSLTNRTNVSAISDPDLRVLLQEEPRLPASWLRKSTSGTSTNKAGQVAWRTTTLTTENGRTKTNETTHIPKVDEVCRWVSYILVDGEIVWSYVLNFNADGTLRDVDQSKRDAKEFDPQYAEVITKVNAEVESEMKAEGTFGRFGSVHTFWRLKKEKLKAKGIEWRSPSELNPHVSYD